MSICRSVLALLLAVSVAMLPVAGHAMARSSPPDMSAMAATGDMSAMPGADNMSASDMGMGMHMSMGMPMDMDCCPHKADHSGTAMDGCAGMAVCGLCFSMAVPSPSPVVFLLVPAGIGPSFVTYAYRSPPGHPPFRPPRV
jgi:hypothetical protein